MAIERTFGPEELEPLPPEGSDEANPVVDVIEIDDGSSPLEDEKPQKKQFSDNLAEYLDQKDLDTIAKKLIQLVDNDDRARDDWKKTYIRGLDLLGFSNEERTDPWIGACGVYHPVMTEAAVRFQSQAIMEVFPAGGPVRTKIIGKWSIEKEEQAKRVEDELNYYVLDKMTEFRPETETLLFYLGLAGSAFRKNFFCEELARPVSRFIPAEDFIVPYGTTDLETCPRMTQVIRMFPNDLLKQQVRGFYLDILLPKPAVSQTRVKEKYDKLEGWSRNAENDERHVLLEIHTNYNLPRFEDEDGVEYPYVITIEKTAEKVLAIRRNWEEGDREKKRRNYYTDYNYLPGLGFYGAGLIHLVGGLASAVTSINRQLVDAGTLSNLPGGLKSRGMRIKGDDTPIMPGEFRDVDVPAGNIRDNITFIPYKEPSQVLHQLMQDLIAEARRLGAAPDLPINAMTQQAPVGTTLALLERSMKVMSAVQARLHASLKRDYKRIAEIIAKDMGQQYEYETDKPGNRVQDFSAVDIIPVSDPNSASLAQRVVQNQALLEMARQDPTAFDLPYLYRESATILGASNVSKIVKDPNNITPKDPVAENMSILTGEPVKAYLWQDHEAHIQVHMNAAQDPKILEMVGQSPQASRIQGSMAAHIQEHIAMAYRRKIEEAMGVPLPPPDEPLPQDIEVQLSKATAEASKRVLQGSQAEMAQKKAQQAAQDPVLQLQQKELDIKASKVQADKEADEKDFVAKMAALAQKEADSLRKLQSSERVAGAALGVEIAQSHADADEQQRQKALDVAGELMDMELKGKEMSEKIDARRNKDQIERERIAVQREGNQITREQMRQQAHEAAEDREVQRAANKKSSNGSATQH